MCNLPDKKDFASVMFPGWSEGAQGLSISPGPSKIRRGRGRGRDAMPEAETKVTREKCLKMGQ